MCMHMLALYSSTHGKAHTFGKLVDLDVIVLLLAVAKAILALSL